jgi:hypothetical protein
MLMLTAIDLGLETVVLIQYKTKDKDDGKTSRFEINLESACRTVFKS